MTDDEADQNYRGEDPLNPPPPGRAKTPAEHELSRVRAAFDRLADAIAPFRHTPEDRELWTNEDGTPNVKALADRAIDTREDAQRLSEAKCLHCEQAVTFSPDCRPGCADLAHLRAELAEVKRAHEAGLREIVAVKERALKAEAALKEAQRERGKADAAHEATIILLNNLTEQLAAAEREREGWEAQYVAAAEWREKWHDEAERLRREIAEAREACPAVRRQDFFGAALLTLVQEEISQLFAMQSRAEQAEAQLAEVVGEVDRQNATDFSDGGDVVAGVVRTIRDMGERGVRLGNLLEQAEAKLAAAEARAKEQARVLGNIHRRALAWCKDDTAGYSDACELLSDIVADADSVLAPGEEATKA